MTDDPVVMPEHYKILAHEMKRLSLAIRDSFVERPLPQGIPWNIPGDLQKFCDDLRKSVERLSSCVNTLPGCSAGINPDGDINIAMSEAVRRLNREVTDLIGLYHKLWQRPFPDAYIDGQPIMSAMFEDLLRDCLSLFRKVIDIVELPPEQIPVKYGSTNISLSLTFNPNIAHRMLLWLNEKQAHGTCIEQLKRSEPPEVERIPHPIPDSTCWEQLKRSEPPGSLLKGMLLGWWWGHK